MQEGDSAAKPMNGVQHLRMNQPRLREIKSYNKLNEELGMQSRGDLDFRVLLPKFKQEEEESNI